VSAVFLLRRRKNLTASNKRTDLFRVKAFALIIVLTVRLLLLNSVVVLLCRSFTFFVLVVRLDAIMLRVYFLLNVALLLASSPLSRTLLSTKPILRGF